VTSPSTTVHVNCLAAESRRRRETVRQLRAEAEARWQTAKQQFEKQLLES
jgi:hypothetical protein